MWSRRKTRNTRFYQFFRLSCIDENLFDYYKINFQLMQHHKYSLSDLESMMPWEREIYILMLKQYVEEENQRLEQKANFK